MKKIKQVSLRKLVKICSDKNNQGGAVAAPVAGKILSEVLPYLETEKQEEKEKVTVPYIIRKDCKRSKKHIERNRA